MSLLNANRDKHQNPLQSNETVIATHIPHSVLWHLSR